MKRSSRIAIGLLIVEAIAVPGSITQARAQATGKWYYCDPAHAYYPYVASCPVPWREVAPNAGSGGGATPSAQAGARAQDEATIRSCIANSFGRNECSAIYARDPQLYAKIWKEVQSEREAAAQQTTAENSATESGRTTFGAVNPHNNEMPTAAQTPSKHVAKALGVVPGTIVCGDARTVQVMFHMYSQSVEEGVRAALTNGASVAIEGPPQTVPMEESGCVLVPAGAPVQVSGVIAGIPTVTVTRSDGTSFQGVTLPNMIDVAR